MRHGGPSPAPRHRTPAAKERSLTALRFLGSFPRADVRLDPPLPEVVFLGRSNVGKSSLLNAVAGHRLARISRAPGKTRALTAYAAGDRHYFLDLPGYGYARAAQTQRAAFRRLLAGALGRPRLAGVVWLLDIRREPSADDRRMQDRLAASGTRVLAVLTKGDKLPFGQRRQRERELRDALGLEGDQVLVTSARTGEGIVELRDAIAALVKGTAA